MALKAGYKGIKKFIADKLNRMNPDDSFATDAEIAAAVEDVTDLMEDTVGWLVNNLFTSDGSTSGYNLLSNGSTFEAIGWSYSDYIPIESNRRSVLVLPQTGNNPAIVFYNSDKEYISGIAYTNRRTVLFTTPDNAAFCRVSYLTNSGVSNLRYLTVEELLDSKTDISALGTQEGATASKLYHSGEHFYKDGQSCEVIGNSDVAQDATWTLNTNYKVKSVYDSLIKKATFSGITGVNGILIINNSVGRKILFADCSDNYLCLPYYRAVDNNIGIKVFNSATFDVIKETAVTGTYYYID